MRNGIGVLLEHSDSPTWKWKKVTWKTTVPVPVNSPSSQVPRARALAQSSQVSLDDLGVVCSHLGGKLWVKLFPSPF